MKTNQSENSFYLAAITRACFWGSLLGMLWGLMWLFLLITFDVHQLFWTVNAPLLSVYEKVIYSIISPDAIPVGLILLIACFTLTGFVGGMAVAFIIIIVEVIERICKPNDEHFKKTKDKSQ